MKKTGIYILCTVIVVAAVAAALVFALGGKEDAPEVQKPDLTGTWTVAAVYTNDTPTFTPGQYMVFSGTDAAMYKDGNATPFASSSYSVNEANQLLLPDISREYKIDKKTANCVRLYENTTQYMLLIKHGSTTLAPTAFTLDTMSGSWDVKMKGDQLNNGERLVFSGDSLSYYKAGSTEPAATATVALSDAGVLTVAAMNLTMTGYPVSADTFVLVEQGGIVWEIAKQANP